MAAMPELRLQVAFENDPNADPPAYSDISDRLRLPQGITVRRGRQYELDAGQPGSVEMVTLNDDGALTPGRAGSLWWPHVAAGRRMRLAAVWEGIEYPLATTFADSFGSGWPDRFAARNLTALNGTDLWKRLSRHRFASQLAEQSLEIAGDDIIGYLPLSEPAGSAAVGDISTSAQNLLKLQRFRLEGETSFGRAEFGKNLQLIGADGQGSAMFEPHTFSSGHYLLGSLSREVPLSGEFSVSVWLTQAAATGADEHMIALHLGSTADVNNFIMFNTGPSPIQFAAFLGSDPGVFLPNELDDDKLHHICATVEDVGGSSRVLRIYDDGSLVTESTPGTPDPPVDDSTLVALAVGNKTTSTEFPNGFWDGHIAHLMIVGRRLLDDEIAKIHRVGTAGLEDEDVGSRVSRILGFAGIKPGNLDSGVLSVGGQPMFGRLATDVLNELAALDGGLVSIDPEGQPAFHSQRNSRRRVPPAFTLDAAAGEVQGLDFSDDDTLLTNDLTYTGSSGATGRVADQASIDRYTRFRGRADLPLATDTAAALRAGQLVRDFGQTRPRTQSIEVDLVANPHLFHALLAAELSDRFDTTGLPPNAPAPSMPWLVEQIEHRITEQSWVAAIQASPYDTQIRAEDIMDVFTADGTWTKPSGLTFVRVRCGGGGGGGGGTAATGAGEAAPGAGGGGGGYAEAIIAAADLGASETVTVGGGGAGGAAGNNAGSTGSNSSFGTHVIGNGGGGGQGGANTSGTNVTNGGNGGSGSVNTGTGYVRPGGPGHNGACDGGVVGNHGYGGSAMMGAGAQTSATNVGGAGSTGGDNGGGGSGAFADSEQAAFAGGDGASGIVIVENYYWHPEGS